MSLPSCHCPAVLVGRAPLIGHLDGCPFTAALEAAIAGASSEEGQRPLEEWARLWVADALASAVGEADGTVADRMLVTVPASLLRHVATFLVALTAAMFDVQAADRRMDPLDLIRELVLGEEG